MIGGMNRAARAILEARRTGALLDALAPNDQPRSLEEGYTIQQIVTAEWPDKIAGWKVGATSKEVQALLGISERPTVPCSKMMYSKARPQSRAGVFHIDCSNPSSRSHSEKLCVAGQNTIPGMKSSTRLMLCSLPLRS